MAKKKTKRNTPKQPSAFSLKSWWQSELGSRRPILKFWLGFAGVMALFYVLTVQPFYFENVQEPVSAFFASATSWLLNLFGQQTQASGMNISAPAFSLSIKEGCDAIAPVMLVLTGILLFPAAWRQKLKGIAIGMLALFGLNLVRIASLYFVGVHAPDYFEFMHVEFWQVVFIGLAILYFFYWLHAVTKPASHAPAS
ncbi:MAG: exosortase H [Saprospiraceae bacterium]